MSLLLFAVAVARSVVFVRLVHGKNLWRALTRGGVSFTCSLRRVVRFWFYFCSGSKRKLSRHNHRFIRLDATLNHGQVSILTLSRFHSPHVNGVVLLHHKNE